MKQTFVDRPIHVIVLCCTIIIVYIVSSLRYSWTQKCKYNLGSLLNKIVFDHDAMTLDDLYGSMVYTMSAE